MDEQNDLRADLYALAALHEGTHLPADFFREAAREASLLHVTESFRDRLRTDSLETGTAQEGILLRPGRKLMQLQVEAFERVETVRETSVRVPAIQMHLSP